MKQVLPVWQVTPALSAAQLVVSAVAFSVGMLEGSTSLAAREFGYAGQTMAARGSEGRQEVAGHHRVDELRRPGRHGLPHLVRVGRHLRGNAVDEPPGGAPGFPACRGPR